MTAPVDDTPSVSLPDQGDGSRRRRRAERRPGLRLPSRALVAGILLVLVLGAIGWAAAQRMTDRGGDPADGHQGESAPPAPDVDPLLVVLVDGGGEVYGVTILAPARAAIVHVAPGTMVEVPSVGLASLREAETSGGTALLQQSLENVLGLRFGSVVTWDPAALAAVLAPLGDLAVDVAEAVDEREPTGRVRVVVPAGRQAVAPDDAAGFLEVVGSGTSLERIVRHQAFWDAVLAALAGKESPALPAEVTALVGVDVRHHVLPVEAVAGVSGDEELYRVLDDDLGTMVDRLFPGAEPVAGRVRVRILNGVGVPGIAQDVQPLLVDAGAEVTLSGNADRFDYAVTQIVYYDDDQLGAANEIRDALGVGEVVKSLTPLDVVDVTIVVGADFLDAHGG